MSYNDSAHYVAETNTKNRLKTDVKPSVGILSGRNAPGYWMNDSRPHFCSLPREETILAEASGAEYHVRLFFPLTA